MTNDDARMILNDGTAYIGWDDGNHRPCWTGGAIVLDGEFTGKELDAILHFAPGRIDADSLLREAFDALSPYRNGGSDEAQKIEEVRRRIGAYLEQRAPSVTG